jgi:hypothetical protein
MKLPFSRVKDLSSLSALTVKTNTNSESTKRLKNFIVFLRNWLPTIQFELTLGT